MGPTRAASPNKQPAGNPARRVFGAGGVAVLGKFAPGRCSSGGRDRTGSAWPAPMARRSRAGRGACLAIVAPTVFQALSAVDPGQDAMAKTQRPAGMSEIRQFRACRRIMASYATPGRIVIALAQLAPIAARRQGGGFPLSVRAPAPYPGRAGQTTDLEKTAPRPVPRRSERAMQHQPGARKSCGGALGSGVRGARERAGSARGFGANGPRGGALGQGIGGVRGQAHVLSAGRGNPATLGGGAG